jgi:hypothetical protein
MYVQKRNKVQQKHLHYYITRNNGYYQLRKCWSEAEKNLKPVFKHRKNLDVTEKYNGAVVR